MKARLPQGYGGGGANMNSMIKQAQKMQDEMQKAQEELDEKEYSVTVGGGNVEVVLTGKKLVKLITIKPDVVDVDDIEMLQDLLISAFNESMRKLEEESEQRMNNITGGNNLGGLF